MQENLHKLDTINWNEYKKWDMKQRQLFSQYIQKNENEILYHTKRTKDFKPMYANQYSLCFGLKENFDKLENDLKLFLPEIWGRYTKRISDTCIEIFYLNSIFRITDIGMNSLMNSKTKEYGQWQHEIDDNVVIIQQYNELFEPETEGSHISLISNARHLEQATVIFDNNYISNTLSFSLIQLVFKSLKDVQIKFFIDN